MIAIEDIHKQFLKCSGISIDSRTVKPGDCFIAIRGPSFNGNSFAKEALSKGAKIAIVDDDSVIDSSGEYIVVKSGLHTLQQLAKFHRLHFPSLNVVVVAGSNGKTTTKELITAVLTQSFSVLSTMGNLNNHIGVPLTLLGITKDHDFAIIELGANHIGEHEFLCDLVSPSFGVVTNCGKDHLEGYGSLSGVIQSNKEVYDHLIELMGKAFVNSDDSTLLGLVDGLECIYYGQNKKINNQIILESLSHNPMLTLSVSTQSNEFVSISSSLYGDYNASNIVAALTIGHYFGCSLKNMKRAIEGYKPTNNRSQQIIWQSNVVYLDAYNANPSSMSEFCKFIDTVKSNSKIIILGAMEELGSHSDVEHLALINQLKHMSYRKLILVGPAFKPVIDEISCDYVDSYEDVIALLRSNPITDSALFIKGSRKYTLEKIINS
ncbi:MAG: UDP-N-acetylmuramoyl-tripeptide--D-alanyl-D-alanine ligase [Candidatus Margulisiibacteriota bacterium]|nr:UDP-N-acetylmuramoyl-tripeptide--D-alanyl-D-alanine ligase [Candidatus Margulisiibacteriota bacterium]